LYCKVWGRWDKTEQREKHCANFTLQTHRMILLDDAIAGFIAMGDLPTHHWLVKFYLFAAYRNRGIGSEVLESVIAAARAAGKPVRLRVLRVNTRAQTLYLKHGFKVREETAERLFMECAEF
jgi:GNAT superfamily N-acetyltransferase